MSGSGVRKRKLNEDKSAPDEIDASDASVHAKRRRQRATIETGFAALSLNRSSPISPNGNPLLSPPGTEYAPQNLNTASTSTSYASNVTQARSQPVGSAPPPPSEEINVDNSSVPDTPMKSSSWYEPEPDRIVILDLDSSGDESDDFPSSSAASSQQIELSRALLNHLKQPSSSPLPKSISSLGVGEEDRERMQLVLFRPPIWSAPSPSFGPSSSASSAPYIPSSTSASYEYRTAGSASAGSTSTAAARLRAKLKPTPSTSTTTRTVVEEINAPRSRVRRPLDLDADFDVEAEAGEMWTESTAGMGSSEDTVMGMEMDLDP